MRIHMGDVVALFVVVKIRSYLSNRLFEYHMIDSLSGALYNSKNMRKVSVHYGVLR